MCQWERQMAYTVDSRVNNGSYSVSGGKSDGNGGDIGSVCGVKNGRLCYWLSDGNGRGKDSVRSVNSDCGSGSYSQ